MKAKDWQTTAKLIREKQSQATTADSSQLNSFPLSELPLDDSGPPTVLQGPYVPYLQAHPFVCHKVISHQWIVHQLNLLSNR